MTPENKEQQIQRVSILTIIINVALAVFKMIAGIVAHSGALIADAIHSVSDVFTTILVLMDLHDPEEYEIAAKRHARSTVLISGAMILLLLVTGLVIVWQCLKTIVTGDAALEVRDAEAANPEFKKAFKKNLEIL